MSTSTRYLRILGALALAIYALHAANHLRRGEAHDLLWICNLAPGVLAIGCFARSPSIAALPLLWLGVGTPLWLLDALAGGAVVGTGILVHLGGLALAALAVHHLGMPRGSWYRAVVVLALVMLLTRIATPAEHNVNVAFAIRPGWQPYFPSYAVYFAALLAIFSSAFFAIERVFVRVARTAEAR